MSLIQWNEYFSVGVKAMDQQHMKFIDMLNACLQAQERGQLHEITFDTLKDMMSYLNRHFGDEEKMMRDNGYPDVDSHIQMHRNFVAKTNDFLDRYVSERGAIAEDMLGFLKDWFINHIVKIDKQYTDYMHDKGIR